MLIGYFCAALCSAVLSLTPNTSYNQFSTETVRLFDTPVGSYVDDSQPQECDAVTALRLEGAQVVFSGVAPGGGVSCPGSIALREWYPRFGCGSGEHPRAPAARAYILAWKFAWPGCRPPTWRERSWMLKQVAKHHPSVVLWY